MRSPKYPVLVVAGTLAVCDDTLCVHLVNSFVHLEEGHPTCTRPRVEVKCDTCDGWENTVTAGVLLGLSMRFRQLMLV